MTSTELKTPLRSSSRSLDPYYIILLQVASSGGLRLYFNTTRSSSILVEYYRGQQHNRCRHARGGVRQQTRPVVVFRVGDAWLVGVGKRAPHGILSVLGLYSWLAG